MRNPVLSIAVALAGFLAKFGLAGDEAVPPALAAAPPLTPEWQTVVPFAGQAGLAARLPGESSLRFAGPRPNDPFVLGEFSVNGGWSSSAAGASPEEGRNTALELFRGDEFELEGVMKHSGFGGWFLLIGWHETAANGPAIEGEGGRGAAGPRGSGYCLSNFTTRTLRSPWFLTEIREGEAVPRRTIEYRSFDWKQEQPFRLTLSEQRLTLSIGKETPIQRQRLPKYRAGGVILGTYRTAYGPKPLVLQSARVRRLDPASPPELVAAAPARPMDVPVPAEFARLDRTRVWQFNGQADYELHYSPSDPGRIRLVSIQSGNAKGFRHSTSLDGFEREPVRLPDGRQAWRCTMQFSNWYTRLPCLARVEGEDRIALAVSNWDLVAGEAPQTAPTSFEGDGVISFVGHRSERDVRSALMGPAPYQTVRQLLMSPPQR